MSNEKALSISIFCLSLSIILSSIIIGNGIKQNGEFISSGLFSTSQGLSNIGNNLYDNDNVVYGRSTYDLSTASTYLGISESQLMELIGLKDSGMPYLKIGDQYIFSKVALDKWLESARVEINR